MIYILPNEDQQQIIDSARAFAQGELPLARLRNDQRPEVSRDQWRTAAELGLFCIGLPEQAEGIGLGAFDEALVMRELGRVVASPSFVATALAAQAAHEAGRSDWRSALVAGERRAHLVVAGPGGRDALCFDRRSDDDDALLFVLMLDGVALLDKVMRPAVEVMCFDSAVTAHAIHVDLARADWAAPAGSAAVHLRAQLLLAAQLVGLGEEARDMTVEYAKTRQQFGVPIGSFQAVKHRCADMGMACEVAWAQVACAALALDTLNARQATLEITSAKWLAATAAHACGDAAIQLHGGIGYQAECDVHHFMKRAHLLDQAGGNRVAQAALLSTDGMSTATSIQGD